MLCFWRLTGLPFIARGSLGQHGRLRKKRASSPLFRAFGLIGRRTDERSNTDSRQHKARRNPCAMNHLAARGRRSFRSGHDQNPSCRAVLVYGLRKRARLDVRMNLFPDRFSILGVDVCNRVESIGPIVREAEAVECQAAESLNLDLSSLADRYQSGALSRHR